MKRLVQVVVVLAAVAVVAPDAWAQRTRGQRGGGGAGGGSLGLLTQKSVQEELKLSEEQVSKVTKLAEEQRGGFRDLQNLSREERQKKLEERAKANEKAVAEVLKPDQVKRFKQISLQQRGARAFADPEVAAALTLTDEQKEKIKTIQEDAQKETRGLFQGGNREEAQKKMAEIRKATEEKLTGILTAEQKAKWKELTGEPFKGEIRRGENRRPTSGDSNRPRGGARRPNRP